MALTEQQLALLAETKEVHIETGSDHGSTKTIIWIVVVDDRVYVRSVRGEPGRWYQRALANPEVSIHVGGEEIGFRAVYVDDGSEIEAVTRALRDKYPPGGSLDRMTREEVLDTTLRLEPVS
jgi:hypothetical protein